MYCPHTWVHSALLELLLVQMLCDWDKLSDSWGGVILFLTFLFYFSLVEWELSPIAQFKGKTSISHIRDTVLFSHMNEYCQNLTRIEQLACCKELPSNELLQYSVQRVRKSQNNNYLCLSSLSGEDDYSTVYINSLSKPLNTIYMYLKLISAYLQSRSNILLLATMYS